jgi:hypothetical protein
MMKFSRFSRFAALAAAVATCAATTAQASLDFTFTASGTASTGDPISASAHFVDLGGGQLQITLANTQSGDTGYIADTLYGVFFSGATITGLVSGKATAGSSIWTYPSSGNATTPGALGADTALTDPWQIATVAGHSGIDAFTGSNKEGLVSTGFTGTLHTDGISNSQHQPLDQSTAVFILTYSGTISSISDVRFLYNTSTDSPEFLVPEPTTFIAGALLLLPFGASTVRILRNRKA